MTFRTVGLTAEGKRILKFDHDTGRRHSPIIDRIGEVYIVENKSVAAYLRQLQDMGEDVREYISIWNYSEGGLNLVSVFTNTPTIHLMLQKR